MVVRRVDGMADYAFGSNPPYEGCITRHTLHLAHGCA
jgi:hypothetical protein